MLAAVNQNIRFFFPFHLRGSRFRVKGCFTRRDLHGRRRMKSSLVERPISIVVGSGFLMKEAIASPRVYMIALSASLRSASCHFLINQIQSITDALMKFKAQTAYMIGGEYSKRHLFVMVSGDWTRQCDTSYLLGPRNHFVTGRSGDIATKFVVDAFISAHMFFAQSSDRGMIETYINKLSSSDPVSFFTNMTPLPWGVK